MTTRKSISFPTELEKEISRRAKREDRSFSAQVVSDMRMVIERSKRRSVMVATGDGGYERVLGHPNAKE